MTEYYVIQNAAGDAWISTDGSHKWTTDRQHARLFIPGAALNAVCEDMGGVPVEVRFGPFDDGCDDEPIRGREA